MSDFVFKQFTVSHDKSSMRVGTDGVLLGAWAPLPATGGRLLDIGTGCGLIALMTAQRCPTLEVTGIDIDAASVDEARANVLRSPFADRVHISHTALQDMPGKACFDAIVCNPPFFDEELLPPDAARAAARHTTTLPLPELARHAERLLAASGTLSVVLPTAVCDEFVLMAFAYGLLMRHRTDVRTTATKPPKRSLATFCREPKDDDPTMDELILCTEGNIRSRDYARLTEAFYIH